MIDISIFDAPGHLVTGGFVCSRVDTADSDQGRGFGSTRVFRAFSPLNAGVVSVRAERSP